MKKAANYVSMNTSWYMGILNTGYIVMKLVTAENRRGESEHIYQLI